MTNSSNKAFKRQRIVILFAILLAQMVECESKASQFEVNTITSKEDETTNQRSLRKERSFDVTLISKRNEDTSEAPSDLPTFSPSEIPSNYPSNLPSKMSGKPSDIPSSSPSVSMQPSSVPSNTPSESVRPSINPSNSPSISPSALPSTLPSKSGKPSDVPSMTSLPSTYPSSLPSTSPSALPSTLPSLTPSVSEEPSTSPSLFPSDQPSTSFPTSSPSLQPSSQPSMEQSPTIHPSLQPSFEPSVVNQPSVLPSLNSTVTISPSNKPSSETTSFPTSSPSLQPSSQPIMVPSIGPTNSPTSSPIKSPSVYPSSGCVDEPGFGFLTMNDKLRTCSWLNQSKKPMVNLSRKDRYCYGGDGGDTRAAEGCKMSCGLCNIVTTEPTSSPIVHNSDHPSVTPTKHESMIPSSDHPSFTPTKNESMIPSVPPTSSPSSSSKSPSSSPTDIPRVSVSTSLDVEIAPFPSRSMNSSEKNYFDQVVTDWITPLLASNTPPIILKNVNVIKSKVKEANRIRRKLQDNSSTLIVSLEVEGEFISDENYSDATDIPYEQIVEGYFTEQSSRSVLVNNIKDGSASSADSFSDVAQIEVQTDSSVITGVTTGTNQNGISRQNIIIIASAASAGVAILFAVAMFTFMRKKRANSSPQPDHFQELQDDGSIDVVDMFKKSKSDENDDKEEMQEPSLFPDLDLLPASNTANGKNNQIESGQTKIESVIPKNVFSEKNEPESRYGFSNRKHEEKLNWKPMYTKQSQTAQSSTSLAFGSGGLGNVHDDEKSQDTFYTLERIYSGEGDNASYQTYDNYSLDDGIATKASYNADDAAMSVTSGPMKMNLYDLSRYDSDDNETVEVSVGDNGTVISGLTLEEKGVDAKPSNDEIVRTCQAPAGKLGIIIDTTKYGPIVYEVKAGSPLEGVIFKGDRIIGIDDIDTTKLSATKVTKIMAEKCNEKRKLVVASKMNHDDFF